MAGKVVIVDFGLGNLFSVEQACRTCGIGATISSSPQEVQGADALILPGVGAFKEAMYNLHTAGLIQPILRSVQAGKPIMGICLGMQLLMDHSPEFEQTPGLGLVAGQIQKFSTSDDVKQWPVPQIGWNKIHRGEASWEGTPLELCAPDHDYYFVHSFFVGPTNPDVVLASTEYAGVKYCSVLQYGSIFATQFHPEKSGENGLSIYTQWARIHGLI